MISYLLLALASICNSIMDTLTHHFSQSIFRNKNEEFWNPNVSWKFAFYLPYTKYKVDAWHLLKSAMIIFICLAIVFGNKLNIIDFILLGTLWNIVFNIFYNHLLISKK
jgi:hypothetical protein